MDFEQFLNDNKNKIQRFEVYKNLLVIHIEDNGVVEIDTGTLDHPLNLSHIVNSSKGDV